jgi:hypothetical protein
MNGAGPKPKAANLKSDQWVAANNVISRWSKSTTTVSVLLAALNAISGLGAGASG